MNKFARILGVCLILAVATFGAVNVIAGDGCDKKASEASAKSCGSKAEAKTASAKGDCGSKAEAKTASAKSECGTKAAATAQHAAMTAEGKGRLAALTRLHKGERLGMIVDGVLVTAPVIRAAITEGRALVTGHFSEEEARRIAAGVMAER